MTGGATRRILRQRLLVIFLVVMIIPYGRQVLSSPTTAQDFRAFFAAASVVAEQGNPYDWTQLGHMEDRLYNQPRGLQPGDAGYYDFLPFPEGPWFADALLPLTGLPWPLAFAIVAVLLAALLLAATFTLFMELGWSARQSAIAAGCTLLSAIGFINLFMGQVSVVIYAAFVAAWLLARRGHPWWSGIVLCLVWIKPNIGLPLPLVVMLLEPAMARRVAAGFIASSSAAFGLAAATLGFALLQWPLQSLRMWQAVQGLQPDIASVESFFYPALSGWLKTAALLLTLLTAVGYGVWALRRTGDPTARGLTVLLLWMAALPFVQSYDLILLVPVVALLLMPGFEGWRDPMVEVTVWTMVTVPLFYFLGFRLGALNGFSAIPVTLLLIAWHRRIRSRPVVQAQPAVAA